MVCSWCTVCSVVCPLQIDSYCIYIICIILMFLQCVSTVIIVYIIISPLNSYLYIHWILDFK